VESKLDKTRGQLEKTEASKNELIQRLASATSSRSRIEKDMEDTRVELHQIIDSLKQDLVVKERQSQHFEILSDTQAKRLQEYEEAFLGIHGTGTIIYLDQVDSFLKFFILRRGFQSMANTIESSIAAQFSNVQKSDGA